MGKRKEGGVCSCGDTSEGGRGTCRCNETTVESGSISTSLDIQIGGSHYKDLKIQPIEYILANEIPFAEGTAIKYLTRWKDKGGIEDLKKAIHVIEILIEHESK